MATKVGVLGFAHGHVGSYLNEWRNKPDLGITVTAGWDHDAKRLEAAAKAHGFQAYADVQALLASDVQGVVIASETSMHADLVEQAAAAGKAIVVQKPLALTLAEADRIVDVVKRTGVPFTVAWQMRVDPQNLKIKEMVHSGELGRVFMVRRRHGLGMLLNPAFAESWHVTPKYNRDIWADDAAHAVDFIHWLLGVPETATAEIESLFNPRMPMDNGVVLYRYSGGPLAEVHCSFTCPAHENTTEVVAEKGTVIQNFGDAVSTGIRFPADACGLKWYTTDKRAWTCSDIPTPAQHGLRIANLSRPLAELLQGTGAPIATAEDARTSLRMVLACYVSVREGRRVRIDDERIASV